MGRTLSGKNALAGKQQFEYEKNQIVLEMLNQFKAMLDSLADEEGYFSKVGLISTFIQLKKLPKEKTQEFFSEIKKMPKEELLALMREVRAIIKDATNKRNEKRKVSEKQLISARIKSKKRILKREEVFEPMFAKKAGKKVDTAKIVEIFQTQQAEQEETLYA